MRSAPARLLRCCSVFIFIAAMLPTLLWVPLCAAQDLEATKLAHPPLQPAGVHPAPWNVDKAVSPDGAKHPWPELEVPAQLGDQPDAANPMAIIGRWPFGPCLAVAVDDARQLIFEGSGAGIYVLQNQEPNPPLKVAELKLPGLVKGLFYESSKKRLYVATEGAGLRIIDVTTPTTPKEIGSAASPSWANAVYVYGNYAFVAAHSDGLAIFDVSNPAAPKLAKAVPTPSTALDVQVVSPIGWGVYAFVANAGYGVRVIEVTVPDLATEVSYFNTPVDAQGIAINYPHAFVVDSSEGLRIVDISNPYTKPLPEISHCDTPGYAQKVILAPTGPYAYVADGGGGLQVIDFGTIASPTIVAALSTAGFPSALVWAWPNIVYVATEYNDLQVFDASAPWAPTYKYRYHTPSYAQSAFVHGHYAYVAEAESGLWILDVTHPQAPIALGHCDVPLSGRALRVSVVGPYAYVAAEWMNLRIIDVNNPANPNEVGSYLHTDYSYDVAVVYPYAYLADGADGLDIVDISNPGTPQWKGGISWGGCKVKGVAVSGSIAYLADEHAGLRIIDIKDPTAPQELALFSMWTPAVASAVVVRGNYAFVAAGQNGLVIVDIHDPLQPALAGWCYFDWPTYSVTLAGSRAYLGGEAGVAIVDISNPKEPKKAGTFGAAGSAGGIFYAQPYLYVANWELGLSVLAHYASLKVTLKPSSIANSKGRWKVDAKSWKKSGRTVGRLLAGKHKVRFKPVSGWVTPKTRSVTLAPGQTKSLSARYPD
jgi:hypothetical protein